MPRRSAPRTRRKIRYAKKPVSIVTKQKISRALKHHKVKPATKAKIAKKHTGKKLTLAHRMNIKHGLRLSLKVRRRKRVLV